MFGLENDIKGVSSVPELLCGSTWGLVTGVCSLCKNWTSHILMTCHFLLSCICVTHQ